MAQPHDSGLNYLPVDHSHPDTTQTTQSIVTENASAVPLASAEATLARRERSSSDSAEKALLSDPYAYMTPRLKSLVLWENPTVSGGALASSLALVLSCRWISLLNLACALFVFGIAGSFIYVNGLLVFNRLTNKPNVPRPLEKYYSRSTEYLHVDADRLHRRVDYVTDGLNVIFTELAKVVLVEDNKRSLKFIGIFYAIWTLRTWFSTTTLLSLILVSLFAAPRIYLDNQTLIDTQVAKTSNLVQAHVGKGRQVAQEQFNSVYSKAEQFAKEKGLVKKSDKKLE
ncbi:reticulon-like protein of the endoplasmic reticulum [Lobosporangium transversale]|uniref:Reticulon-like protein n=1 Tax=Lobosporangium transversale TaxID=64571 RepID=A0A1Y2GSJ8_9FUNG|nr:Reticulon-domain-containing protein [Lobosporangium transversale]KAF9906502.1 reticulon-like protein of the endoplasmic reticulum [Lobosporangium transversale]ORZ19082.1 Reticulon-domain-containing protein [Lobosporangium transversale]|eukprot:XP_021882250.1 Reticulon-domain-containing protein [Lobosporangium transversale]